MKTTTITAKTDVKVNFNEDYTTKGVIKTTIRALRRAGKDKEACLFQRELCSTRTKLLDVVAKYVTIV